MLWFHPAKQTDILRRLGEVYIGAKKRSDDELNQEAIMRLYARELERFPGDIVLETLTPLNFEWWPAVAEIVEKVQSDGRFIERLRLLRAIEDYLNHVSPEPVGERPSPEYVAKKYAEWIGRDAS